MTTFFPLNEDSDTGSPCWSGSVKSGAWSPASSAIARRTLLQQPRQPPVLEHPSLGLAGRAVAHHVVLVEHRLEPVAAPGARLSVAAMHGERHRELVRQRQRKLALV